MLYEVDGYGFWTGNAMPYAGGVIPARWVLTEAEPKSDQLWNGAGWAEAERPKPTAAAGDLRPVLHVSLGAARARTGEAVTVTAEIRDPLGDVVDVNNEYAVPLLGLEDKPVDWVDVPIVHGRTPPGFTVSFPEPGLYRVTERGINLRLPMPMRLAAEVEIIVKRVTTA